jgi:diguanylate cyclase (GGDEF)-like protein/PAS domain S-box-containing protein
LLIQAKEPYRIVEANEIACKLLGYTKEELLRMVPQQLASENMTLQQIRGVLKRLMQQKQYAFVWSVRTKEGATLPVEMNCRLIASGGEEFILAMARDRTERLQMEKTLKETEHVFDSLFDHNPNGVGVFDKLGNFVRMNQTMERIMGYTAEEVHQLPFLSFVAEEHLLHTFKNIEQVRGGQPKNFDTAIIHKQGYRVDLHTTAVPILMNQETNGYIAICQDITERKRVEEKNRYMAYYDDMTGLPNRRLFKEKLHEALESAKKDRNRVAVFYLDIDRFKLVNDCFGHDYGDMVLMQAAERFTRCISEEDFIARTEGDEFAVCFKHVVDEGDLLTLVARIESILEPPFAMGDLQIHMTVSIGIAVLTEEREDADTLMKYADIALSRAKERGKNGYQIYNSDMKSVSINKLTLENELRKALMQKEFILYYQPQMEIETGNIVGVEALIRWKHPEKGMVPPKDFIPFAEESGLIGPIGEWVLYEACKQNKLWQEQGFPRIPVSVNLSSRQFLQHNLIGKIAKVLQQTGLEARFLELEITESMTMDVELATNCLLELKKLGVQVSIDDFGTGYSSLYYLKKFPIDKLKIDRSFVRDIMEDPNDAAIVATIISMTRHLNLRVIAEGVETKEQLHFLHENRCNVVQGYWFSPPISVQQMDQLLAKYSQAAPAKE